ncbi:hypothetical protein JHK87_055764 [Glycine soja]|nr:hypothetical protein JHK87_055764 [Glycine soja]
MEGGEDLHQFYATLFLLIERQLQFYVSKFAIFQVCATLDKTEGVNNINIFDSYKKNRIQVSNSKQPLFFYVNLAKVPPLHFQVSKLARVFSFHV